jgi:hypothetical protein
MESVLSFKVCGVNVRVEGRCSNGACLACHYDYCDMVEGHTLNIETSRSMHAAKVKAMFRRRAKAPKHNND